MIVLALNCGSSTVKFQSVSVDGAAPSPRGRRLARGVVEIGDRARITFQDGDGRTTRDTAPIRDHQAAVERVLAWRAAEDWRRGGSAPPLDAVGHRVVHGGPRFSGPAVIDGDVLAAIEGLERLAPLHNAPSLAGIRAARAALGPDVPMVAVFDTAFHARLPEHAARYAIPLELARKHDIRRYGFHGTSYRYVLARYCELTGTPVERACLVVLHLGSGCSAAAIRGGRSVDTSMGFTPLEGLVMGTRSGDLDPALIGYLARVEGVPVDEVERWLNERSGLLGLAGTHDMRDLLERARDDPHARLAVEVFCHRARKYVGAYLAALGEAEAVVFTGGIAENSPEIRARIASGMEWCGLVLDTAKNGAAAGREERISVDGVRLAAFVIPTDEEVTIAWDTARCLAGIGA